MIKTVATYTTALEAYIVKGRLESEGVPAFIADEHYIGARWDVSLAIGGVRLQVPASYLEQARSIMVKLEQGHYQEPLFQKNVEIEFVHCPRCYSDDTHFVNWIQKLSLLAFFLAALPLPYSKHRFKCARCKHSWIATEQRGHGIGVQVFTALLITVVLSAIFYSLYYWKCNPYQCEPLFEFTNGINVDFEEKFMNRSEQ